MSRETHLSKGQESVPIRLTVCLQERGFIKAPPRREGAIIALFHAVFKSDIRHRHLNTQTSGRTHSVWLSGEKLREPGQTTLCLFFHLNSSVLSSFLSMQSLHIHVHSAPSPVARGVFFIFPHLIFLSHLFPHVYHLISFLFFRLCPFYGRCHRFRDHLCTLYFSIHRFLLFCRNGAKRH